MIARALFAGLLVASAMPALAAPRQITAGEFLAKAEPMLKKSKVSLMFSSEARKLVGVLGQAAQNNRTRLDADKAAGRKIDTCLPEKGKAKVNANELLAHIKAMPPAQKALSFDAAFASYTAKKYPCRA
jgi:hypothetical protein